MVSSDKAMEILESVVSAEPPRNLSAGMRRGMMWKVMNFMQYGVNSRHLQ